MPFNKINGKLKFIFQLKLILPNVILFLTAIFSAGFLLYIHFKYKKSNEDKFNLLFACAAAGILSLLFFVLSSPRFEIIYKSILIFNMRLLFSFFVILVASSALYVMHKYKVTKISSYVLLASSGIIFLIYIVPTFSSERTIPIITILKQFKHNVFAGFILLLPLLLLGAVIIHLYVLEKKNSTFIQFCGTLLSGFAPAILWFTCVDVSSTLNDFSAITYGTTLAILWVVYQIIINFGAVHIYSINE